MPGPDPRKTRPLPGRRVPARPLTREERKKLENKKTKKTLSIKDAAKQVIAEGGSPGLIQDEARMNRMDKLLGVIPPEKMAKGGRAGFKSGSKENEKKEFKTAVERAKEYIKENKKRSTNAMELFKNKLNKAKGGRVGLKAGSTGCKLAMKGKGRAYGKNS